MPKPLRLPDIAEQQVLDELEIELVVENPKRERWNQLVVEQHYLHSATLVGEQLRYAVRYQGRWVALLGWNAPAWHLRLREAWLGWSEQQRSRRLHFIAQNSRFLILADRGHFPNLGTRAMKLCLERLSQDWQAEHGHPILALESFVDGQLFRGTIYKAANWTLLGPTAGYGRVAEDFYVPHERPKQLWVRVLEARAREWLSAEQLPEALEHYQKPMEKYCELCPGPLASLRERFAEVAEFRKGTTAPGSMKCPVNPVFCECCKEFQKRKWRPSRWLGKSSCWGPTPTRWWRSMARPSSTAKCIWLGPSVCPRIAVWESSRWLTRATKFPPPRGSLSARRFGPARWSVWTHSIRSTKPWPKSSTTKEPITYCPSKATKVAY